MGGLFGGGDLFEHVRYAISSKYILFLVAGKPYKVRFPVVRVDFVKITWQPPLHPNGAIQRYEVAYKLKGTTDNWVDVIQPRYGPDILYADVHGLAGNRYYLFRVYARTGLGRGTPAEETVITTPNRREFVISLNKMLANRS